MEPDEYRRAALETWQTMASGWERQQADIDAITAPVRTWLVRELRPQPGDTVLELAAGPGETGFEAARLLGDDGHLISTDFSPAMVEVARRRGEVLGIGNVEHRVMDAEHIELEDDSVDGALCRFGYMLMPDPAAALSETRRVLRPGGRLALAVWTTGDRNPWVSVAGRVLVERGLVAPPEPGTPGMFTMGTEERTRELVEGAGFTDVRVEEVPVRFLYGGVDEYVSRSKDTGGMFAKVWGEASEDEQAALKGALAEAFSPFEADGGYEFPGVALCAVAS